MMSEKKQSDDMTEIHEVDPWRRIEVNNGGLLGTYANGSSVGFNLECPETRRKVARALAPDLMPVPSREDLESAMAERVRRYSIPNCGPQIVQEFADEALAVIYRVDRETAAEDAAVAAFKEAWHEADGEGASGDRVRRGLRAALKVMKEQGR